MCNFVCDNKARSILDLFPETKLHIQKYDGLGDIEIRGRALEVTLGSSTDMNLGHNHTKIYKNVWGKSWYFRIEFSRKVVGP
jgi:hypothetical protein